MDRIIRQLGSHYRFVVACLDEIGQLGEQLIQDGVSVTCLARRPGFDWRCVRQLRQLWRNENVSLVHAHQYTPFAYALATRVFGRRPPVLFTEHGRFFPDRPSQKRMWFNRLLTGAQDRFVAVGAGVRDALIQNEGLPGQRITIIHNGIDLPESTERASVRAALGVEDNDFVVMQVARLDPIKDHQTAIRAIVAACRQNPKIRLFIVGDGPERQNIHRALTAHQVNGHVQMLGLRNDVPRLLAAADAFILTSVSEGIPVTVIEAMAAGVPVVATKVGGLPELVTHSISGYLTPPGDASQLAEAVLELAADPTKRAQFANRAKSDARTKFSQAKMMGSYASTYEDMLRCPRYLMSE